MARSIQYPHCCKAYNIYEFIYDSWFDNIEYRESKLRDTKKSIQQIIARRLNVTGYKQITYLFTATVNDQQGTAKQALEELGFELQETIDNKKTTGSIVYFYKKQVTKG
jgi:hypothetical protein